MSCVLFCVLPLSLQEENERLRKAALRAEEEKRNKVAAERDRWADGEMQGEGDGEGEGEGEGE